MSPAPWLPADLYYADSEPVQLDVAAIMARGVRLRRRRLLAKVAVVAAVCAIMPAVVVTDMTPPAPTVHSDAGQSAPRDFSGRANADRARHLAPEPGYGINSSAPKRTSAGPHDGLSMVVAPAGLRLSAAVPSRYGRVLAIAGARSGNGVWFTAASTQLTLFHLSNRGRLRSWPLPEAPSRAHARGGVGLAVTTGGVVWVAVSATLIRFDPRSSLVSSWRVPAPRSNRLAARGVRSGRQTTRSVYSVAVAPDGNVAVALSKSSSVQVLDPWSGTFSDHLLPTATDQPLAVGYTLTGTLGIGFRNLARAHSAAIMLLKRSGARLTAKVAQSSAVTSYGRSGLLVGTGRLDVVSPAGNVRPLVLPSDVQNVAQDTTPPVPLPGDRLAVAQDNGIVTFPAAATSVASAASESELWLVLAQRCGHGSYCPDGYRQLATDADGDVWAVPNADRRAIVLLSLR